MKFSLRSFAPVLAAILLVAAAIAPAPAHARHGRGSALVGGIAAGIITSMIVSGTSARAATAYPPAAYSNGGYPAAYPTSGCGAGMNYPGTYPYAQGYGSAGCPNFVRHPVVYPAPVYVAPRPVVIQARPLNSYPRRAPGREAYDNRHRNKYCGYGTSSHGRC